MRLLSTLLTSLILLTASSCDKDEKGSNPQPPTTNPQGRPAITQADLTCRVIKNSFIRQNTSGTTTIEYTHEYDTKGRRSKITGSDGSIRTYEYNTQDQLVKVSEDYPAGSSQADEKTLNEYDSQGRWVKGTSTAGNTSQVYAVHHDSQGNRSKVEVLTSNGQLMYTYSYAYLNGNMIKFVFRGNNDINPQDSSVTTYQYLMDRENKNKPVAESMGQTHGFQTASTNLTSKEVVTHYNSYSNNGLASPPIEYSYQFNDKGYPTSITMLYTGSGAKVVYLYEYQCK